MASNPDTVYFSRRARQSTVAVNAASDLGARLAHSQLAAAYELLAHPVATAAQGPAAPATPASASSAELAVWANEGGHVSPDKVEE